MNDKNSILEYPRINYYAILSLTLFYLFIIFIYQSFETLKRNRRSPFCLIRIHNLVMWLQTKKNIPFQEETTNRQITSWKYFWSEIFLVCSDEIRLSHIWIWKYSLVWKISPNIFLSGSFSGFIKIL